MKPFDCLKWTAVGSLLAISALSQARYWDNAGAYQDASLNLYTASYYPNSAKIRVSKRSSSNSSVWVKDFSAPSGYKFTSLACVKTNPSTGDVYVAATMNNTSTSISAYELIRFSSTGTALNSVTYAPASAGYQIFFGGMTLDSSGNVYFAGAYNTAGTPISFIVKYSSSFTGGLVRGISVSGYSVYVDDIVADGSGNVYLGGYGYTGATTIAVLAKFDSTFPSSPTWQQNYSYTSNVTASGSGCLTLDGSGRLTYIYSYADANNSYNQRIVALQYTTGGTYNWVSAPNVADMTAYWSIADSSGDVEVVGSGTSASYKMMKFDGSTGSVDWTSTISVSGAFAHGLCQDASGDYLAVRYATSGGTTSTIVDRFAASTGSNSTSYTYSSSGGDYGFNIFPSGTAATFFVTGVGLSGGSYYPFCYRAGTSTWSAYQTATTP